MRQEAAQMGSENDQSPLEEQMNDLAQPALAEIELLYKISTLLNGASGLEEILQAIVLPGKNSGAASAALFTFELGEAGQPEWARVAATWAAPGAAARPVGTRFYLPDVPFAGLWLEDRGNVWLIADINQEQRIDAASRNIFLPVDAVAVAMVPLLLKERWIGLAMINWHIAHRFSSQDQRLYQSLAGQAAVVVDNRLLFEQTRKRAAQLERLSEIEAALSRASSEAEILAAIALFADAPHNVRITLNYLEADASGKPVSSRVAARWQNGAVVTQATSQGEPVQVAELPAASLWLNAPDSVLFIEDLLTDPRINQKSWSDATEQAIRAMAVIPLRSSGRWQGFITLTWPDPRVFTLDERFVLRRLLEPAAAVVASHRAYLAQQETSQQYQQILDALPDMVLVKAAKSRIVWANKAFRDYYGMSLDELQQIIDAPFNEPDYTQQYIKDDAYVFDSGQTLNILEEPCTRYDGLVRPFHTIKSPIFDAEGQVIFTVGISRDVSERKQALANAEVLYNTGRRLSTAATLPEITAAVAEGLNIPAMNRAVLVMIERDAAGEIEGFRIGANWYSGAGAPPSPVGQRYTTDTLPAVELMLGPEPLFFDNVQSDKRVKTPTRKMLRRQNTQAMVIFPLWVGGNQAGAYVMEGEASYQFAPTQIRAYPALVGQLAAAVENRRLFEQVSMRARREQVLREVTAQVHSAVDVTTVMRVAVQEVGRVLGRPAFIYLDEQAHSQSDQALKEQ